MLLAVLLIISRRTGTVIFREQPIVKFSFLKSSKQTVKFVIVTLPSPGNAFSHVIRSDVEFKAVMFITFGPFDGKPGNK